jgi:hypothetical protein
MGARLPRATAASPYTTPTSALQAPAAPGAENRSAHHAHSRVGDTASASEPRAFRFLLVIASGLIGMLAPILAVDPATTVIEALVDAPRS